MVLFVRAVGRVLGAFLFISGVAAAEAAQPPRQSVDAAEIPRIEGAAMRIDGQLDEPAWRAALAVELSFESKPGDGTAPPVRTLARLVHDDHRIYVAFEAFDPEPEKIRAHLTDRDRDSIEQDDYVGVLFDTYNDSRRGFEFRVNPRGVQRDGLYSQLGTQSFEDRDFTWDAIWDSAGRLGPGGYVVELAIPFDQLRFLGSENEQVWGIGLFRSWPRDVLHQIDAHRVDRDNTCALCQLPRFTGFAGIAPGKSLELTPTLTFDHTDQALEPGGGLDDSDDEIDAGLSLRWGITPSLALSATLNPDFSQIEADALQLPTNQRFALQYDEKRPFFLEGTDLFFTQILAIFTRTVDDPRWGVKLTGKPTSRSALGFFVVEDEVNNLLLPSNDGTGFGRLPGQVTTAVGRYRQDIGKSSNLGAVFTLREGENGYHNELGGFDLFLRPADRHQLFVQALSSKTTYPEEWLAALRQPESSIDGEAIEARYQYQSRNWLGSLGWRRYDRGFRADAGFVPRVDFETWRLAGGRTFWSDDPTAFFNKIELNLVGLHTRDREGRLTDHKWEFYAVFDMPLQSKLTFDEIYRDERSGHILFENLATHTVRFEIQPGEALRLEGAVAFGDAIDYVNQRLADQRSIDFTAEVKPGIHWNTKLVLTDYDLDVAAGRLVDTRLADFQLTYNFSTRSLLRAIVQHVDIDYEPANDPAGQRDLETLASQLLFSYKINPQTLLFVGYSDGYLGVPEEEEDYDLPGALATGRLRLEPDRRSVFVKMSYAFTR